VMMHRVKNDADRAAIFYYGVDHNEQFGNLKQSLNAAVKVVSAWIDQYKIPPTNIAVMIGNDKSSSADIPGLLDMFPKGVLVADNCGIKGLEAAVTKFGSEVAPLSKDPPRDLYMVLSGHGTPGPGFKAATTSVGVGLKKHPLTAERIVTWKDAEWFGRLVLFQKYCYGAGAFSDGGIQSQMGDKIYVLAMGNPYCSTHNAPGSNALVDAVQRLPQQSRDSTMATALTAVKSYLDDTYSAVDEGKAVVAKHACYVERGNAYVNYDASASAQGFGKQQAMAYTSGKAAAAVKLSAFNLGV